MLLQRLNMWISITDWRSNSCNALLKRNIQFPDKIRPEDIF